MHPIWVRFVFGVEIKFVGDRFCAIHEISGVFLSSHIPITNAIADYAHTVHNGDNGDA